ncbi:MAG: DUF2851 family protein [Thermomicrobiales bacterium]
MNGPEESDPERRTPAAGPVSSGPGSVLPRPRELALSAAWNGGLTRTVTTVDGRRIDIVFPGHWSHGFGPDFHDAMLDVRGEGLRTGSVEIHLRTSDWTSHRHHLDPRYNDVILHIVSRHDALETRRADGKLVPIAVLDVDDAVLFQIDARLPEIWTQLGSETCAPDLARDHPERLVLAIQRLGDERLTERVSRFEGDLSEEPPGIVLERAIFDAFGYTENRQGMAALHDRLATSGFGPGIARECDADARFDHAAAILLGLGGFLPLSPADAHMAGISTARQDAIEAIWVTVPARDRVDTLPPTIWQRARTRPANHPATRIVALAGLLANMRSELLEWTRDWTRSPSPKEAVDGVRELTRTAHSPTLGTDRAIALVASVLIPFAIAYAHAIDDPGIVPNVVDLWDRLPGSELGRPARRAMTQVAGDIRLRGLGERGNQGLLHLDRTLCTPRRCMECPIATEVLIEEREVRSEK